MYYVYLIESIHHPTQRYVGCTNDLKRRMEEHNRGESLHTSKFHPWDLKLYIAFQDKQKASDFEHYLQHGSGHAFASKHFW